MRGRGRKPPGPEFVYRLVGTAEQKERLKAILETLLGQRRLTEASADLEITPQRFHMLREQAMQGAMDALAPRPLGRPPQTPTPQQERIDALECENELLRRALESSGLRTEIAVLLAGRQQPGEKKRAAAAAAGRRGGR